MPEHPRRYNPRDYGYDYTPLYDEPASSRGNAVAWFCEQYPWLAAWLALGGALLMLLAWLFLLVK